MIKVGLLYRQSFAELNDLHVLVSIVDHRHVSHPREPRRYVRGQVTAKQLSRQRVEGADCDAHLHVHAAGPDEEANALRHHRVQ